jgi:HlyD family secretion protein
MKHILTRKVILILLALFGFNFLLFKLYVIQQEKKSTFLTLYGNVDVRQVDLGFRVFGRVTKMPFEEGDFVESGSFMGCIERQPYLDQVREAEANVEAIKASLLNAERIMERRQAIVASGAVSDEDYQNALAQRDISIANLRQAEAALGTAMTNLIDTEVYAPTNGTILTRIREPGTVVNIAEPIYTLSVSSPVWIRAYVSEPNLGKIYPGMTAIVSTDSGKTYEGKIGFISPVAEFTPKTVESTELRTDLVYRIRIYCDNPDRFLLQGMPVTVKLALKDTHSDTRSD